MDGATSGGAHPPEVPVPTAERWDVALERFFSDHLARADEYGLSVQGRADLAYGLSLVSTLRAQPESRDEYEFALSVEGHRWGARLRFHGGRLSDAGDADRAAEFSEMAQRVEDALSSRIYGVPARFLTTISVIPAGTRRTRKHKPVERCRPAAGAIHPELSDSKFSGSGPPPPSLGPGGPTISAVAAAVSRQRVSSPVLVEDTVPDAARWWTERTRTYVRAKSSEWSEEHTRGILMALARYLVGRDLKGRPAPGVWQRVGLAPAPTRAREVTADMVARVKRSTIWAPKTRNFYLQALRGFLRWEGAPLAEDRKLWAMNARAGPRLWLTREQLASIWNACRDDADRLIVAAGGMNGLRRVEVRRLRGRDVRLDLSGSEARIEGKTGTRTIPVGTYLRNGLVALDRRGPELYFPHGNTAYDDRLKAIGKLAGLPFNLSAHILRRSFGRVAYRAGVPIVDLQHIYGHASPEMTAYYIGIESDEMAAGLVTFERALAAEVE